MSRTTTRARWVGKSLAAAAAAIALVVSSAGAAQASATDPPGTGSNDCKPQTLLYASGSTIVFNGWTNCYLGIYGYSLQIVYYQDPSQPHYTGLQNCADGPDQVSCGINGIYVYQTANLAVSQQWCMATFIYGASSPKTSINGTSLIKCIQTGGQPPVTPPPPPPPPPATYVHNAANPSDVSGDGSADVLAIKPDGTGTLWYYPNSSSTNPGHEPFTTGTQIGTGGWNVYNRVAAADVSGDGSADVLAWKPDGTLWYYPNSSSTNPGHVPFTTGTQIGTGGWNVYSTIF